MTKTEFIDSLALFVTDTLKKTNATEAQLSAAASIARRLLDEDCSF